MKNFTDKYIQSVKPSDKKQYIREVRGFTLQVMPSGVKTFLYIYTMNGKRRNLNLGMYPATTLAAARQRYLTAYGLVQNGVDPNEPVPAQKPDPIEEDLSFGHFSELYLAGSEKNHVRAWHATILRTLKKDILPYWKDVPVTDIRRRDAITLLERVAARSAGQVSNVQKVARAVLDYALQREYLESNPLLQLTRVIPELKYEARDRTLSEAEIRKVWKDINDGPGADSTKRALKLILVTAQRPGEVAGMQHSEIDGCWWTIPWERAQKGTGDHMVYLSHTALKLIGSGEGAVLESSKLLGSSITRNSIASLVSGEEVKEGVTTKLPYYGLPRWTPHDLRRTARTHMARIGIIDEHAEAVIGHCKQGVKRIYNRHEYQEEKKQALTRWEKELLRILS